MHTRATAPWSASELLPATTSSTRCASSPGLTILCQNNCSIDLNVDVHYLFDVAPSWKLYPLAGLSANDIFGWSCGINLGVGTDYAVADRWNLSAGLKYRIQTARFARNPFIISLGASYRF